MTRRRQDDERTGDDAEESGDAEQGAVTPRHERSERVFPFPRHDDVLDAGRHHQHQHDGGGDHHGDQRIHGREDVDDLLEVVGDHAVQGAVAVVGHKLAGPEGEVIEQRRDDHKAKDGRPRLRHRAQVGGPDQREVDQEILPRDADNKPAGKKTGRKVK